MRRVQPFATVLLFFAATRAFGDFSFAVFGDMQASQCSGNAFIIRQVNAMSQSGAAFYISTGDLIAGYTDASCFGGNGSCTQAGQTGSVHDNLTPLMRTPPTGLPSSLFLAIGNHDDGWGDGWYPDPCGGGICDVIAPTYINHGDTLRASGFYKHCLDHGDICSKTQSSSGHGDDYYYSFTYQDCYFIVLRLNNDYYGMLNCNGAPSGYSDCESYCTDTSLFLDPQRNDLCYSIYQYDWFLSELRKSAAFKHVFVFAHAPLMTSSDNHPAVSGASYYRAALEKANVAMYFNGHNHCYERTVPVRGDRQDSTGVVYVTVGPAGGSTDGVNGDWFTAASYEDWTTYNDQEGQSGYVLVTVRDNGSVRGERHGISNALQDSFTLARPSVGVTTKQVGAAMSSQSAAIDFRVVSGRIRIEPTGRALASVEVLDVEGRSICRRVLDPKSETAQELSLPRALAAGLYLAVFRDGHLARMSARFTHGEVASDR